MPGEGIAKHDIRYIRYIDIRYVGSSIYDIYVGSSIYDMSENILYDISEVRYTVCPSFDITRCIESSIVYNVSDIRQFRYFTAHFGTISQHDVEQILSLSLGDR